MAAKLRFNRRCIEHRELHRIGAQGAVPLKGENMIMIKSKNDGFRRCGIAHTKAPVEYQDDKFSKEEITILKADPMLNVVDIDDNVIKEVPGLEDMTVVRLKALLDKLNVQYDSKAAKTVLIGLVDANTDGPYTEG